MSDNAQQYDRSIPLPPTQKQMIYARNLAMRGNQVLPWDVQQDRKALSEWIDAQKQTVANGPRANLPTSKQVAFAEKLARLRRTSVPDECFRDRQMLSNWIESNK